MPTVEEQLVEAKRTIQRLTGELKARRAKDDEVMAALQAIEAASRELQRLYAP